MAKKNFLDGQFEKDVDEMSASGKSTPVPGDFTINAGPLKSVAQVLRQEGKSYALLNKIDEDFSEITES